MTKYFFHIHRDGTMIKDPDGEEFASLDAALAEAVEAARELVATAVRMGQPIDGDRIEICDEDDRYCGVVRLADVLPPRRVGTPNDDV